jgi:putative FmdB family regulatory protein
MPIYEYRCQGCSREFEALVTARTVPLCPTCGGGALERLISSFGVSSQSTRSSALQSGQRQLRRMERDRAVERREVIAKHDH